jgi:hypothetical protein
MESPRLKPSSRPAIKVSPAPAVLTLLYLRKARKEPPEENISALRPSVITRSFRPFFSRLEDFERTAQAPVIPTQETGLEFLHIHFDQLDTRSTASRSASPEQSRQTSSPG